MYLVFDSFTIIPILDASCRSLVKMSTTSACVRPARSRSSAKPTTCMTPLIRVLLVQMPARLIAISSARLNRRRDKAPPCFNLSFIAKWSDKSFCTMTRYHHPVSVSRVESILFQSPAPSSPRTVPYAWSCRFSAVFRRQWKEMFS